MKELLERLSKAAPDWIRKERSRFLGKEIHTFRVRKGDETLFSCARNTSGLDRFNQLTLFGAICEKIETEGWQYSFYNRGDGMYCFGIQEIVNTSMNAISFEQSKTGVAEAAALALCEALESRQEDCQECKGTEQSIVGADERTGLPIAKMCPACNGTSKQQEDPQ